MLNLPIRKSQRLKNYDYSKSGAYFITICTQSMSCLFGRVENGKVRLNKAGNMINSSLIGLDNISSNIKVDKFVIMPNHIHAIILLNHFNIHQDQLKTLSSYIKRFKTYTTRCYIEGTNKGEYLPFTKKLWQKSFYDRVIRNYSEYLLICNYISDNPRKWDIDKYYSP